MRRYEMGYQAFINQLVNFVTFFYEGTRQRIEYWQKAQDIVDPERKEPSRHDFVVLLSGLYGLFADLRALTSDDADLIPKGAAR
jgi:hypothetical protein